MATWEELQDAMQEHEVARRDANEVLLAAEPTGDPASDNLLPPAEVRGSQEGGAMRLIHLHEEQAWQRGLAAKNAARGTGAGHAAALFNRDNARRCEETLRERMADVALMLPAADAGCPAFIPNALLPGSPPFWRFPVLCFGVPDAERVYRSPGMRAFYEANPELLDRKAAVIYRDAPTGLILAEGLA